MVARQISPRPRRCSILEDEGFSGRSVVAGGGYLSEIFVQLIAANPSMLRDRRLVEALKIIGNQRGWESSQMRLVGLIGIGDVVGVDTRADPQQGPNNAKVAYDHDTLRVRPERVVGEMLKPIWAKR
jgi:hypothetical protein